MNHLRPHGSWRSRALSFTAMTAALAAAGAFAAPAASHAAATAPTSASSATGSPTGSVPRADAEQLLKEIEAGGALRLPAGVLKTLTAQGKLVLSDLPGGKAAKLCAAETHLVRLAQLTSPLARSARSGVRQFAAALDADILGLQAQILSRPGTRSCGGSGGSSEAATPTVRVLSSSPKEVTLHLAFPAPVFAAKQGGGKEYVELFEQGSGTAGPSAVGSPELPVTGETVAVPAGASASVKVLRSTSYLLGDALIWPLQPAAAAPAAPGGRKAKVGQPLDPRPPFTVNGKSYRSAAVSPAVLATSGAVGSMRGLRLTTIRVAGATYRPAKRQLRVISSVDVRVTFGANNTGSFGSSGLTDPWSQAFDNLYQASIVNWATVRSNLRPGPLRQPCGEEMMVITSSALQPAAETFASDRTAHGVLTTVFVTDGNDGIGVTPRDIWTAIDDEYSSATCIRPEYVTLFGDTSQVPTFELSLGDTPHTTNPRFYEDPVATDMPYGFLHQGFTGSFADLTDFNQDVLVGRIPAPDLATATSEVAAITGYDDTPPTSSAFYSHVTAASFFQPCPDVQSNCGHFPGGTPLTPSTQDWSPFLRTSEYAAGLARAAGKTVNRVTSDESNYDSVTITPRTYDDGQPITAGITYDSSTSDLTSRIGQDIANGSFLVWHSDHGYDDGSGWYEPPFRAGGDVSGLADAGELPVVLSLDCDSGKFDSPDFPDVTPGGLAFGPDLLETTRAVGFIGSSRQSPMVTDGDLLEGMGTVLFPHAAPGSPAPVVELGALLDAAKSYMEAGYDLSTNYFAAGTVLEYNDLGDPSTVIRRDQPRRYLPRDIITTLTGGQVRLSTTQRNLNGGVVTLLSGSKYLGRGVLAGGKVIIASADKITDLKGLTILLAGDGFRPTSIAPK